MKTPVYLNVYDLHHANSYGYPVGLGAFHTGVEIGDKEYAYGGHEYNLTGVYESTPKVAVGAMFRDNIVRQLWQQNPETTIAALSVLLGETTLSRTEIQEIINQLAVDYVGNGYHPFTRNCNSFSNDLSLKLFNKPIPSYINRLPYLGSFMSCIPINTLMSMVGLTPPTADSVEPSSPTMHTEPFSPRSSENLPFFGTGYTLGAGEGEPLSTSNGANRGGSGERGEGGGEESEEERRERVASAAYKRFSKPMI